MTIQVVDTLVNPSGEPIANAAIKVYTVKGYGQTLTSSIVEHKTDDLGQISFDLVVGVHRIETELAGDWHKQGLVNVLNTDSGTFDLSELLALSSPVEEATLVEMRLLLAGAEEAETNAEASAVRAESEADRAEAAVGDIEWARYARTQADMEAEREANKNLFAASGICSEGGIYVE